MSSISDNNRGFTMMELLASVVILGILMAVAVPASMKAYREQKNKLYVEDAIKLISTMQYRMKQDNFMKVPLRGGCIVMDLYNLDNTTFDDAPNEGYYDKNKSFVVAHRNSKDDFEEYTYYVTMVEKTKAGSYMGVKLTKESLLHKNNARKTRVSSYPGRDLIEVYDYRNNLDTRGGLKEVLDSNGIHCDSVYYYSIEE